MENCHLMYNFLVFLVPGSLLAFDSLCIFDSFLILPVNVALVFNLYLQLHSPHLDSGPIPGMLRLLQDPPVLPCSRCPHTHLPYVFQAFAFPFLPPSFVPHFLWLVFLLPLSLPVESIPTVFQTQHTPLSCDSVPSSSSVSLSSCPSVALVCVCAGSFGPCQELPLLPFSGVLYLLAYSFSSVCLPAHLLGSSPDTMFLSYLLSIHYMKTCCWELRSSKGEDQVCSSINTRGETLKNECPLVKPNSRWFFHQLQGRPHQGCLCFFNCISFYRADAPKWLGSLGWQVCPW